MMLARACVMPDDVVKVQATLQRSMYKTLARVPITLALLIHTLRWEKTAAIMSKIDIYNKASELMFMV